MIYELAVMKIDKTEASEFEAAFAAAAQVFQRAEGCHSMALEKALEKPGEYRLRILWESLDAHMDTFRNSEGYQECKKLVEEYFKEPPVVVHTELVKQYF